MVKWPFESGDLDKNGEFGVNDEYGEHSPIFSAKIQMRWQRDFPLKVAILTEMVNLVKIANLANIRQGVSKKP